MSQYKYMSSTGKLFDLCQKPIFVASFNDMRSSSMEPVYVGDRVAGFARRKGVIKPLRFQYLNRNRDTFTKYLEAFYSACQEDIRNNVPGRIYIGDYFIEGFFFGSAVEIFRSSLCVEEIQFLCIEELWTKELGSWIFENGTLSGESASEGIPGIEIIEDELVGSSSPINLGSFPGTYPAGLAPTGTITELKNTSSSPSPFRLIIYGPTEQPTVTIGGHFYSSSVSLLSDERLIIDSREKTMIKFTSDGNRINVLHTRNKDRDKYIFQKIPVGVLNVVYSDINRLVLTLFDERSSPLWS